MHVFGVSSYSGLMEMKGKITICIVTNFFCFYLIVFKSLCRTCEIYKVLIVNYIVMFAFLQKRKE